VDNKQKADAHRAEANGKLSAIGQRLFKYVEFDSDEEMLAEIRKHPIGLIAIASVGLFVTLAVAIASIVLASNLDGVTNGFETNNSAAKSIIVIIGLTLSFLALIMTAIYVVLYRLNVVFITSEKIAEVVYPSLFNRKVTQLSIGNVQDVTTHQKGILPHLFNYGTLLVETAGEIPNREFTYVPDPHPYSNLITEAHEHYVEQYGN
jgi:hypothetical protein